MKRCARWLLVVLLALSAGRVVADEESFRQAKALYLEGESEFQRQHYDVAYSLFERAYQASSRPELLFNMATCLAALDRPREAAARLRAFVDRMPQDPQRAAIEERIAELKERAQEKETFAQLEREGGPPPAQPATDLSRAALEERIRVLEQKLGADVTPPPPSRRRRRLAIGLGVTAGVLVVGGAIALGLVLSHPENYTASSFGGGPLQSTR